jgi:hypothetical protein
MKSSQLLKALRRVLTRPRSSANKDSMEYFKLDPEMVALLDNMDDEELRAFAEIEEHATSDTQVEQYIYICSLIFTRTGLVEYLERAMHIAEGWVAVTSENNLDYARRCQILDSTLAKGNELIDMDTGLVILYKPSLSFQFLIYIK